MMFFLFVIFVMVLRVDGVYVGLDIKRMRVVSSGYKKTSAMNLVIVVELR